MKSLLDILKGALPPMHGEHGGPLVRLVAHYEDGSKVTVYHDPIKAAYKAIDTNTGCDDCGRRYGHEHGFPDLIVTNSTWRLISPSGDTSGLLCPSCICARLAAKGVSDVAASFLSGPIRSVSPELMTVIRQLENMQEKAAAAAKDQQ